MSRLVVRYFPLLQKCRWFHFYMHGFIFVLRIIVEYEPIIIKIKLKWSIYSDPMLNGTYTTYNIRVVYNFIYIRIRIYKLTSASGTLRMMSRIRFGCSL